MNQKKTWIKICGLTQVDNALDCARFHPDAIGLVFFEKSPRNVTINQAQKICSALPASIEKIGVFVDEPYEQIIEKADVCGLTGVQLHGNESPQLISRLIETDLLVIKALFAAKEPFLQQNELYTKASYLLVEYGKGVLPGGNAESWNYEISRQLKTDTPVILAGGLSIKNIAQAIKFAKPSGVDISSGVEVSFGIKDIDKVEAFIAAVRSVDQISRTS